MTTILICRSLCLVVAFLLVALHVQRQMIRAREATLADLALERLGSGVLAVVTSELVGAGKPPLAAIPGTKIWFLTSVDSLVSLQMGRLGVHFDAAC